MKKEIYCIAIILILILIVRAEKLDIQSKNSYYPGDKINFKVNIYDDNNNIIYDDINYEIQNFYTEIIVSGTTNSRQVLEYNLPENAIRGHWAIIARYKDQEKKQLFNVLELEKADIKLEGQKLFITNIGNVPYRKPIQITIGDHEETALVPLGVGETKEIKLTAPEGIYKVGVSDGTKENSLVFEGVQLTGNVIGLEKPDDKNFFIKYKILTLFFIVIILAIVAISVIRTKKYKS